MKSRSQLLPAATMAILATAVALTPVYTRQTWFWPSVFAIATAFGIGALTRRLDVPAVLSPAVSLLGLGVLAGMVFFRGSTAFGLPTPATLSAIGAALSEATRDIRQLAAPVDPTPALTMLTTCGIYLVAMVVDLIVFRAHRPAAAGLPLLALYLVPASLAPKGTSVLPFVVAAAGYIWLLVAEGRERARGWGRRLVGIGLVEELADLSPVARVGRRLGAAAVGVALVVPVFVPSFGDGLLGSGGGLLGSGSGPSSATVVNPIVELQPQLRSKSVVELMRVRTSQPDNLRLTSLDLFDGATWSTSVQTARGENRVGKKKQHVALPSELTAPGALVTAAEYQVTVGNLKVKWLPAPYAAQWVKLSSRRWVYDPVSLSIFSSKSDSRHVKYTVFSVVPTPVDTTLEQVYDPAAYVGLEHYLKVPPTPSTMVLSKLDEVTRGATTAYQRAMALQRWFHDSGQFKYSLEVKRGNGITDLTRFLTVKTGYCEQFAATMAYMARLAHIPARVAIGFTPGTMQADGSYLITNKDAHAWPELWFPNVGWVRFEPTPRSDGASVEPSYARTAPGSGRTPSGSPSPTPSASASVGPQPTASSTKNPDAGQNPGGGTTTSKGGGGPGGLPGWALIGLVLLALALATPFAVAVTGRSRRWQHAAGDAQRAHAAWDTIADAAEDTGYPLRASDSPRAAAGWLAATAGLDDDAASALRLLAAVEERARYARTAPAQAELEVRARVVRRALLATLSRRRRLRAVMFPASTLRRTRERVVVGFDVLDRRQAAMWAGLRRAVARS